MAKHINTQEKKEESQQPINESEAIKKVVNSKEYNTVTYNGKPTISKVKIERNFNIGSRRAARIALGAEEILGYKEKPPDTTTRVWLKS